MPSAATSAARAASTSACTAERGRGRRQASSHGRQRHSHRRVTRSTLVLEPTATHRYREGPSRVAEYGIGSRELPTCMLQSCLPVGVAHCHHGQQGVWPGWCQAESATPGNDRRSIAMRLVSPERRTARRRALSIGNWLAGCRALASTGSESACSELTLAPKP